jgi:hypothetical protein
MAKKHMRKCSPPLAIKEMCRTTLRFHLIPVRLAIITNTTSTNVDKDVRKKESLYTLVGR